MIANPLVKFAWSPTPAQLEAANVVRLAHALGCEDYTSLHRVSVEEPERFWRTVADDLQLELARPWDNVRNDSRGIEWTTWFEGARLNLATACLHAWAARTPDATRLRYLHRAFLPHQPTITGSRCEGLRTPHSASPPFR